MSPALCDQARKAIQRNRLIQAGKYLEQAAKHAKKEGPTYVSKVNNLYTQLNRAGEKLLGLADKLYAEGKYVEAIKEYERICRLMMGLPVAKRAAGRITEAKKDPTVQSALAEADASKAYAAVNRMIEARWTATCLGLSKEQSPPPRPSDTDLIAKMPIDKQAGLLTALGRMVADHGETPSGKKAGELLKKLQADKQLTEKVQSWLAERVVKQAFKKASVYEHAKLYKKAAACYEDFLAKHPDSEYAPQARQKLTELKQRLQ